MSPREFSPSLFPSLPPPFFSGNTISLGGGLFLHPSFPNHVQTSAWVRVREKKWERKGLKLFLWLAKGTLLSVFSSMFFILHFNKTYKVSEVLIFFDPTLFNSPTSFLDPCSYRPRSSNRSKTAWGQFRFNLMRLWGPIWGELGGCEEGKENGLEERKSVPGSSIRRKHCN